MVEQIETLKVKYEYISKIRELNMSQDVFRIPKYLFVKNILTFLEDGDIMTLSYTCKFFSIIIFNPFTLRLLLAERCFTKISHSGSPLTVVKQDPKKEDRKINNIKSEDVMAQLETLKMVKEFMTEKVKSLEETIRNNQKELNQLKKDLFYERSQNIASAEKILVFENKLKALELEKQDYTETVKELNVHYQKIVSFFFFWKFNIIK